MSIFQLDFPFLLLSISQNWNSAFTIAFFGLDFPFPLFSISQNWNSAFVTAFFGLDFPFLLLSISQKWNSKTKFLWASNTKFVIFRAFFKIQIFNLVFEFQFWEILNSGNGKSNLKMDIWSWLLILTKRSWLKDPDLDFSQDLILTITI